MAKDSAVVIMSQYVGVRSKVEGEAVCRSWLSLLGISGSD